MNLRVFMSDRCNMSCDYCFLRLNRGAASILDEDRLERAIEAHLRRHGSAARVTFLGGEPLLHWKLLRSGLGALRRLSRLTPARVATNGTLLRPERLKELQELGADVVLSLDGAAPSHDRHRRMAGPKAGPSFAAAIAGLAGADRSRLRVNMVLREDTAPHLLSNLAHLAGLGLRQISFHLDVLERWTERGLETLRGVLAGVGKLSSVLGPGFRLTDAESYRLLDQDHDDDDVVLGADGCYYPCVGFFSLPYAELSKWSVGDAVSGLDEGRRDRMLSGARARIHAAIGGQPHFTCGRETYFHEIAAGRDPAPALRAFHRADRVFGEVMSRLAPFRGGTT